MKKLLGILVLGLMLSSTLSSADIPVDYKIKITDNRLRGASIIIVDSTYQANLMLYVTGECTTFQRHSSGYFDYYSVFITDNMALADKVTCILDAEELDTETRRIFNLD